VSTAIIGTGGIGSAIARLLASGGESLRLSSADQESARTSVKVDGVDRSGRLEVGGDLHDVVGDATEARPLVGAA
jgi:predicted dinucleotide-binding enzyme